MTALRPIVMIAAAAALSACSTAAKVWPFGDDKPAEQTAPQDGRISILSFEQKLEADTALAGRTPFVPTPVDVEAWPQPGGPADNAPAHATMAGDFSIVARRDVGAGSSSNARISSPPVIADGKVFVFDADQRVSAFPVNGGGRIWSRDLSPRRGRDKDALGGGVAFADGKIYVTSGFGFAAALDATTGAEVWRTNTQAPIHAAPTVSGGRVFAVTNDSELIAIDATSGVVQWTHQAIAEPARILAASSPAVRGDTVVAPFASGEVVALLAANGRRLWVDALTRAGRLTSLSAINDIAGRPVALDGVVYAASHSGILAAIDQRTGQRIWARGLASTQTPWVAGDTLYVVTIDGELTALERTTGQAFWVTQLRRYNNEEDRKGRISWTGPLLAGGKLVLASSQGDAVIVNPTTGAVEKTLRVGGPVYISPVAAGGQVYLLTDEGKLVVLR
ncbi:MAG: PQQ-binding-like beta-propeller repeat protein [Hyphomonadaceae bacterium]|nr:MAG: Pyrrolo-quinoline quinone [Caulobacteraceae bacterium]MBT9446915.1 PQQ-binding-like beta-propeller repeat protein [Hyphomonadaceae bacterium]TPW08678.1 MAG: Pyrrolo-quinoline quinone [Alphaproteobacteria bacterium]